MKVVTVVGARPQFIKAAAVSRKLRKQNTEILIHTGQHYDKNMSEDFFTELHIPLPNYNLGVGSGTPAKQTAEMMIGIENVLTKEKPDVVLIYGDTNSTLAGALAAVKLHIPIAHVEAGLRSFNRQMPEEINRIIADHMAGSLFCPTNTAVENLMKEGITKGVYQVGDVMCDTVLYYSQNMEQENVMQYFSHLTGLFSEPRIVSKWYLATIHRVENTDNVMKLQRILSAFEKFPFPVIFPAHPRIQGFLEQMNQRNSYENLIFTEPLGYLDMLFFTKNAVKVITDSGGLQKECYILGTPCVTVREQTEWVETLKDGHNILAKVEESDILNKVLNVWPSEPITDFCYGDGNAAEKIVSILGKCY